MIEIICENEPKKDNKKSKTDAKIKYPKNVKQMGEPSKNRKIYIEDYAYTYLTTDMDEQDRDSYGILVGEARKAGGQIVLMIRGAVKADDKDAITGYSFSKEVWSRLYEQVEEYFNGQQILGWYVRSGEDEVATFPDDTMRKIHFDNFSGAAKTLLVINEREHTESFYMVEGGKLVKQGGFFCFYERNENMQDYMLAVRPPKSVDTPNADDTAVASFRTIIRERKEQAAQHRGIEAWYGVCAFMVIVITIIGVNILNSYEKMQTLDESVSNIAKEIANMNAEAENNDLTVISKIDGNVYPTQEQQETNNNDTEETQESVAPTVQTTAAAPTEAHTEAATQVTAAAPVAIEKPQRSYIVKKGDTLNSICRSIYGDTKRYQEIMQKNNLDNPDKIYEGQELILP